MTTWWVGQSDLDEDQVRVISRPVDDHVFVTGPPGSGKTNLLLLRANYLYRAGHRNIAVLTFTRSLREFIASGASQYSFPTHLIMTCKAWQQDFLTQYGLTVNSTGDFEQMRQAYLSHIQQVVDRHQLSGVYDAILLDEAQDYLPAEIRLFSRLATRLFCVADERQKIYQGEDSIAELRKSLGEPQVLRFHYRNGINICRVADEVAKKLSGYKSLAQTCNYDEIANPSTVDYSQCDSIEEQARLILSRIGTQLATFPGQLLGILCPKRESMYAIWNAVKLSDHASAAFLLHGSSADTFPPHGRIVVSTFHAAKGLEFRALHLAACDELKSFKNNRRMTFTAVTRAKTALSVYHTGPIHPYFDAALRSLEPAPALPSLDDLFGGLR